MSWSCGKCQSGVRMVDGKAEWCDCPSTVEFRKRKVEKPKVGRKGDIGVLGFSKANEVLKGMGL